jgi:hypothetical protein
MFRNLLILLSAFLIALTMFGNEALAAEPSGNAPADLIVFDRTDNVFMRRSADGKVSVINIAKPKGEIVSLCGDYDGDGTADIGYWSISDKTWTFIRSSDGQTLNIAIDTTRFAAKDAAAIPVTGNFDGDRRADIGFFVPRTGTWYFITSVGGYDGAKPVTLSFGTKGDIPVVADYDGDGTTDAAVFRPASDEWIYRSSSTGETFTEKFTTDDKDVLVPADYDGDGKADLAKYGSGTWTFLRSSDRTIEKLVFGFADAMPTPTDIDGDGVTDPSFYRDGVWYFYDSGKPRLHTLAFGTLRSVPLTLIAATERTSAAIDR